MGGGRKYTKVVIGRGLSFYDGCNPQGVETGLGEVTLGFHIS